MMLEHPYAKFWFVNAVDVFDCGREELNRFLIRFAFPIGKESDQFEESEYIGEEAGPLEHYLAVKDRSDLAAFIFETQKRRKITNNALLGRAGYPLTP